MNYPAAKQSGNITLKEIKKKNLPKQIIGIREVKKL